MLTMKIEDYSYPHRRRRVQQTLSHQSWLLLLGVCLVAVGSLIFIYATGISPPQQVPKRQPVRGEITYETMFREVGQQYGLDWRILACQAYYESEFNPLAVGVNRDAGLMQIIPVTWNEWAPQVGVTDPHDPYSNVLVAAAYLAFLRDHFAERGYTGEHWMLVAYNWGPYNLQQHLENGGQWTGIPRQSRDYALNVLRSASEGPPGWETVRHQAVKTISASEAQFVNEKKGYLNVE